jgi:7-cyano-7-deazaguanine synthase
MKDNTPEFLEEINRLGEQATHHGGYKMLAPLITYDKDKVVKLGDELGVPWQYTYSCYAGHSFRKVGGKKLPVQCGTCSNCKRRKLAFSESGVKDPSIYAKP